MNTFQQLTTGDVWCPSEEYPLPGVIVKHIRDEASCGMIVARVGTELCILWSVQPDEDVVYFRQKLFKALKIPPVMLGYKP